MSSKRDYIVHFPSPEYNQLRRDNPNSYLLLTELVVGNLATRRSSNPHNLAQNETRIFGRTPCGLETHRDYREAMTVLTNLEIAEFYNLFGGKVGRLLNTELMMPVSLPEDGPDPEGEGIWLPPDPRL